MTTLERILSYSKSYKLFWVLSIVGFVLAAIAAGLQIFLIENLTATAGKFASQDEVSNDVKLNIFLLPIQIVALFTFMGVSTFMAMYFNERLSYEVAHKIRQEFFKNLQFCDIQYIKTISTGEMLSKLIFNIEIIRSFYSGFINTILRDALVIVTTIGAALLVNWKLTLVFFSIIPFVALTVAKSSLFFKKYNRRVQESMAEVSEIFNENIKAQEVTRVYTQQENQIKKFDQQSLINRSQSIKLVVTRCFSILVVNVISGIGLAFVIWSAFSLKVGVEELMSVFAGLIACARPFKNVARLNERYSKIIEAADMLFEQMIQPHEVDEGQKQLSTKQCHISVNNIKFAYPQSDKSILNDISFDVPNGKTVALVGRSGSGKSTLIQLMVRLFNSDSGSLKINDTQISEFTLDSLRKHISLVTQQPIIFAGSIYENIAFGQPHANKENVMHAAKLAYVWEFAKDLEGGLEAQLLADGSNLSGGQRQRIAIARAFLKDAPILLLDEATSALDNQSEAKVQQALNELMQNKTTLLIAHRLTTVKGADQIIVLDQGVIVQKGTYDELSAQDGLFKLMLNQVH